MTLFPRRRRKARRRPSRPSLRFTPWAWAKLLFLRDCGETEVGGFGISSENDPLLVADVALVRQAATSMHVAFDDEAVADYFDRQVDCGLTPERVGRIWIHTHPGDSPAPSPTDERTFARAFGGCDWSVMMIVARGGRTYARLRFNAGPGGDVRLPVAVDFEAPFAASDPDAWRTEYERCVRSAWDSARDSPCNSARAPAVDLDPSRAREIDRDMVGDTPRDLTRDTARWLDDSTPDGSVPDELEPVGWGFGDHPESDWLATLLES